MIFWLAAILFLGIASCDPYGQTQGKPNVVIPPGGIRSTMMGGNTQGDDYLREENPRIDGYRHYDIPKLIKKLKELHANHYTFVIWNAPTDFEDLEKEFMPAAQKAGLQVMAYIAPPSECFDVGRCSRPHKRDYIAWAKAFAQLSVKYNKFTAWAIDDFSFNQDFFTPQYLSKVVSTFKEINPNLGFYTTAYYFTAKDDKFLDKYAPFVNGFIYPYLGGDNSNNQRSREVVNNMDVILNHFKPRNLQLILLVYSGRFLDATLSPDADYVKECVEISNKYAGDNRTVGVITYGLPITDLPAVSSDNRAMYGNGRLSLAASPRSTKAGGHAEAWQIVEVDPNATRYEISFWVWDQYSGTPELKGYHYKRVILDGKIIYNFDVMDAPQMQWLQGDTGIGPVDVTHILKGKKSAKLELQQYEGKGVDNFQVDVGFDHIESIGFKVKNAEFEHKGDWNFSTTSGTLIPSIRVWHHDEPQRIFNAVSEAFKQQQNRFGQIKLIFNRIKC